MTGAVPELTAELMVDSAMPAEPVISPDGHLVAYAVTTIGMRERRRGALWVAALYDPGEAHEQADERNGQMQMADQDDADDDKQQAGQAQPYPVRFVRAEYADQVEDPREDHEDANHDRDEVQRPRRMKTHDDSEDQCQHAENQRRLP